jgi:hypothetical protein
MIMCPCGKPAGMKNKNKPKTYCSNECRLKYQKVMMAQSPGFIRSSTGKVRKPIK